MNDFKQLMACNRNLHFPFHFIFFFVLAINYVPYVLVNTYVVFTRLQQTV